MNNAELKYNLDKSLSNYVLFLKFYVRRYLLLYIIHKYINCINLENI